MAPRGVNRGRILWARRLAIGLFLLAALSQARVQIFQRGSVLASARETNRFIISRTEFAKRGAIFTSDGKPLAQDDDTYEFSVNFKKVPHSDAFFVALGEAAEIPASDLAQMANSGVRSRTWRKPMSSAQARSIQSVKLGWRADGVSLGRTNKRAYPLGVSAAGFVGAMNDIGPLAGLELSQNSVLAGRNGLTVGFVDRSGAFLPTRLDPETRQKVDGQTIILTIDSLLQQEATAALKVEVERAKADSGVAIVMNPNTGDILALANWPSYDPNTEMTGIAPKKRSDYNAAYMSALEPGSTFKILTLARALDRGLVGANENFFCNGSLTVWAGKAIRCDNHGGTRAHGAITPEMGIARSCNVWAATLAARIGHPEFVRYIEQMGLLEKTQMGVPLETKGLFNYKEYAKPLQLATLGFGQSVSCTPVGLAAAFAMLGNDGKRPSPRLIKRIGDKEQPIGPQRQIVTKQTAATVMQFMEAAFSSERGTAKGLRIPGYRLAGKTGTAQRVRRIGGGGYVANFVGFVPAEKPRAMILVMVDNPKGEYYGGLVAGPVFKEIAKAVIRRFSIPPSQAGAVAPKPN